MGLLQKTFSLFSKKREDEPVVGEIPAQPTEDAAPPVAATTVVTPPDGVVYIYSHGFTNGVYRIEPDKDSFERFLEYCNQVDRLKELRALKEKEIGEVEAKLNLTTSIYNASTNIVIEQGNQAANISVSIAEVDGRRVNAVQKELALVTQAKETVAEYSWVPALLYFMAGLTFIIADISITKQITSWGFNMSGWQSWIFAFGLAFTAFLIKPTIDRMLEKPFQAAGLKLKTLYKIVLLGIATVGLVMLFWLGKFRADSEIAKNKIEELSTQMNGVNPNSPQFLALQTQVDGIQKSLDENFYGQHGLILSGMLFAIGGAICLSIAFSALKQLINRYWILPIRIRTAKSASQMLDARMTALRSEQTAIKSEQEKAEKSLQANEPVHLKEVLKQLQEERSNLLAEFYQAQFEKERALYFDGRNKGEKYGIEGELLYKVSRNDHSSLYLGKQNGKNGDDSATSPRSYTRRPFVKMRKMIADNFNKNLNNQTYDGSEFEIVT